MLKVKINHVILQNKTDPKIILGNIQFSLQENQIYSIMGLNGAGKTTLLFSLTNLLDKNFYDIDGKVLLEGKNILELDESEILNLRREKIRYVFQDAANSFDQLKKFEYYFSQIYSNKDEINSLLDFFILPNMYELNKLYPYEVSGGMSQRINLVLALLGKPKILLLDEPTSALDISITNLIYQALLKFKNETDSAILIITQDLNFALKVSDKIAYLRDGSLTNFHPCSNFSLSSEEDSFLNFKTKIEGLEV